MWTFNHRRNLIRKKRTGGKISHVLLLKREVKLDQMVNATNLSIGHVWIIKINLLPYYVLNPILYADQEI